MAVWIVHYAGKTPNAEQTTQSHIAAPLPASAPIDRSIAPETPATQPGATAASPTNAESNPIALSRRRLDTAPAGTLAIMIGAADHAHQAEMETLYNTLLEQLPEKQVLLLPARLNGRMGWGVFYGFFQDRSSAAKVLANLPEALRKHRPFIRTVEGMKNELN